MAGRSATGRTARSRWSGGPENGLAVSLKKRLLRIGGAVVGLALLLGALWIIRREFGANTLADMARQWRETSPVRVGLALALTVVSYLAMAWQDLLAARVLGIELSRHRVLLAGFVGFAFAKSLPFAMLSGGAVRTRFYTGTGTDPARVAELVLFNTVTYILGLLAAAGLAFTLAPGAVPGLLHLPVDTTLPLGIVSILLLGAFLLWSWRGGPVLRIRRWRIEPTSLRIAVVRTGLSLLAWASSAAVLFVLLPDLALAQAPAFFGVFLLGQMAGLVSQLPAGIGVFEAVVVRSLRDSGAVVATLGGLILYRAVYHLLPLLAAIPVLVVREIRTIRRR